MLKIYDYVSKIFRSTIGVFVILLCLSGITLIQHKNLQSLTQIEDITAEQAQRQEQQTQAQLEILQNLPSLGFDNLVGDWTFLQFLQYFGDGEVRSKTGYALSSEFFEIIVDRNPQFIESYSFLSSSVSVYSGQPEKAVALMEQGLKSLSPGTDPRGYLVWRYKGIDELLFLNKPEDARRSFEKAAEWASLSFDPQSRNIARISQQTAQFLAKNPASKRAQISSWASVLNNAPDQPTRQLAIQRIQSLGGKVAITPQGEVTVQLPEED